ncbi:MAG: undecaprenyl-diphosphate phosphatase [Candidatus Nanopelagicaceae bacterium]|nr:undecaprenyl-diphosphate phosphatase [Candidatus Nanopelagicaceae bacterium]
MLEAIFLGIVQGLTEFLPISSSAHVRVFGEFLPSGSDPGATFTAIMQIGTEIAVLIYFRGDLVRILKAVLRFVLRKPIETGSPEEQSARLGGLILLGSIPIFVLGYLGQSYIRENFRSLWLISFTLIFFGIALGLIDHYGKRLRNLDDLNRRDGVIYGLAQSLALVPGVSRSGATIAMGRFLGYKREAALRYSFLLAIPAVLGSGSYELLNSFSEPTNNFSGLETAAATLVAFIVGYIVIAWLMKFVQTRSFMPFVIYRIFLGILIIVLLQTGLISA